MAQNPITFQKFLLAMNAAVAQARAACAQAKSSKFKNFLVETNEKDQHGEPVYRFKTTTVALPDGKKMEVPLWSMEPAGCMDLKEVELEFSSTIAIAPSDVEDTTTDCNPQIGMSFKRSLLGNATDIKVKMKFDLAAPCETGETLKAHLNGALNTTT